jgi:hypothetical protein
MKRLLLLAGLMLSWLGVSADLQSQVLVYEIDIRDAKGVNFNTFKGGFVVAPLLGGAATFLLTSSDRTYIESSEGGKLFTAVTGSGDQKAVISATTGLGTAAGSMVAIGDIMVAIGDINHVIKVNSPTLTLAARVAKTLLGALVSADDESEATSTALDGSIGSAGIAELKLVLDESLTNRANKDGLSVSETVEQVSLELERHGFSPEGTDEPQPEPTTPGQ